MKKKKIFPLLGIAAAAGLCALGSALTAQPEKASAADSTVTVERYGATMISGDVKYVYDQLVTYVARKSPAATVPLDTASRNISEDELNLARDVFISDYPECFWYRGDGKYYAIDGRLTEFQPEYIFTGEALTEAQDAVDAAVEDILSRVVIYDGSTTDVALALHDLLAAKVEYELVGEHQTVYGALVSGKAVCAGYAAAYQLLLQRSGIKAITVTGSSRNIPHAWNAVWLDEDTCVYTDVTWDDQGDDLYHYYFNLSKAEMEEDHVTNTEIFKLPDCDHTNESYFDAYGFVLTDTTTAAELADSYDVVPVDENTRTAVLYDGTTLGLEAWLEENKKALYRELGGILNVNCGCSWTMMGKEAHLTVTGQFISDFHTLQIETGDRIMLGGSGTLRQYVSFGEEIEETVLLVVDPESYYFRKNYSLTKNGLTVTWKSYEEIVVSGRLLADTTLTLTDPTEKIARPEPTAVFALTGNQSGVLSGLEVGMEYRLNSSASWTKVTEEGNVEFEEINDGFTLHVAWRATNETEKDGVKTFHVTRPDAPELTVVQPKEKGDTGRILTSEEHEYSADGGRTWTDCNGELTGLAAGTYYVRRKWGGLQMTSKATVITIEEGEGGLSLSCSGRVAIAPFAGLLLVGVAVLLKKRGKE